MKMQYHPSRLSPNALTVLRQRYLVKNERGVPVESPAEMFHRVADDIASAESPARRRRLARQFYEIMAFVDLPSRFTDLDERRTAAAAAFSLFCVAGGRLAGIHL